MSGLDTIEAVVFDLDGTLYEQRPLRHRMLRLLALATLRGEASWRTLRILQVFRHCRERLATAEAEGITRLQYDVVADRLGLPAHLVEATVMTWMHERPLPYLAAWRAPGALELLDDLRQRRIATAVLSDFSVGQKLVALGLRADVVVSAEDPEVDRLKPHPRGLERTAELLGIEPCKLLVIGDRPERDGAAAARLDATYLRKVWRRTAGPGDVDDLRRLMHVVGRVESPPQAAVRWAGRAAGTADTGVRPTTS